MKDELGGKMMTEFTALRLKMMVMKKIKQNDQNKNLNLKIINIAYKQLNLRIK